ncbi:MAG: MBL fold metallo-hydrolase, partial [Ruthenibacterium sp.]
MNQTDASTQPKTAQSTQKNTQNAHKTAAVQTPTGENAPARRRNYRPRRKPANAAAREVKSNAPQVKIYPLGGLGEVGKNITLYECNGDMILVDCGLVFPESDMFGIDLVIPDFTFVLQNKERIKGLIITHGHEDHIGSLPYLLKQFNLPVYATRLT